MVDTAVPVGELQLNDREVLGRPEPADLSLHSEAVVLQLGGGEDSVGGHHCTVTSLAALLWHSPDPPNLIGNWPFNLLTVVAKKWTFIPSWVLTNILKPEAATARLELQGRVRIEAVPLIVSTVGAEYKLQVHWGQVLLKAGSGLRGTERPHAQS